MMERRAGVDADGDDDVVDLTVEEEEEDDVVDLTRDAIVGDDDDDDLVEEDVVDDDDDVVDLTVEDAAGEDDLAGDGDAAGAAPATPTTPAVAAAAAPAAPATPPRRKSSRAGHATHRKDWDVVAPNPGAASHSYRVYVIQNPRGRVYSGYTRKSAREVERDHDRGTRKSTRRMGGPWTAKIIVEPFPSKRAASRFESLVKAARAGVAAKARAAQGRVPVLKFTEERLSGREIKEFGP